MNFTFRLWHLLVFVAIIAIVLMCAEKLHRAGATKRLYMAAQQGDLVRVKAELRSGTDVNAVGDWNTTALMMACAHGHIDIVMELLSHGARVDGRARAGQTPLIVATKSRHRHIVQLLLDRRADPMIRDSSGKSAIDYAIESGDPQIRRLFDVKPPKTYSE